MPSPLHLPAVPPWHPVVVPSVGERDGFGRHGVLDETDDGLLCAECGWTGAHLGLHVYRAHGMTADAYRARYGLLRSRGLVASNIREKIQANGRVGMPSRAAFVARRDPAAATRERLRMGRPATAEEAAGRDARMSLVGRRGRIETVIACEWCGVEFCPLGTKRRRFCSRSCASRHTRQAAQVAQRPSQPTR
jgi:hypothetical protein